MNGSHIHRWMNFILALSAIIAAGCPVASAQETSPRDDSHFEFGIDPAVVITRPIGTLDAILGVPPCSDGYRPAGSVNLGGFLWTDWVLSRRSLDSGLFLRGVRLSVGIDDISSDFEDSGPSFQSFDVTQQRYVPVTTIRTASFTLQYLRMALESEWGLGGRLLARFGPTVELPLSGSVEETEGIDAPENATFADGSQRRIVPGGSGPLDDPGIRLGFSGVLAYRLPLGRAVFFEPTLGIDYGLTRVQPEWSPLIVHAGITVGFGLLPAVPATRSDTVVRTVPAVVPSNATPPAPPFEPLMKIAPLIDGEAIEARREIVARYIPVLPTIFFDRESATIARRYRRLRPTDVERFSEKELEGDAEESYRDVLNVVGARLVRYPDATVTLTGSASVDEPDRPELSRARAESVAAYLVDIWGIDRRRITVRAVPDPAIPSNSAYEEGRAENRRIELSFDRDELYEPIAIRSIEPVTRPTSLDFAVSTTSAVPIANWRVELRAAGQPLAKVDGSGAPPDTVRWSLTDTERERILAVGDLSYALMVADESGRTARVEPTRLPVHVDTSVTVATSASKPADAAEFLLITFDFDRAELTRRGGEELKTIIGRIGPNSRVEIVGYTDRFGDEAHNRELALERARLVADRLPAGIPVVYRGANPGEAPYDDSTPQGRFLSRTVRVVVTNPK